MIKKLFMVTILGTLALSACSGRGAAETPTPAATDTQVATAVIAATETVAPAMTDTFTPQPNGTPATATPTVGTPAPTNPPDCTNSASFVADITIPDNTNIGGGTIFTKTWRIANTGTCVWGPSYTLVHYSEEFMGAPSTVPLSVTFPGQNADISVNLTAPTGTGKHQANFVIKNPEGLIMKIGDDSRLWVVINVTVEGAAASIATATATGATTATNTVPAPTFAPATRPAGTLPAAATSTSSSGTGNASCLFAIDTTKLMDVIDAVNAYRAQKSLSAYIVNPLLAQAAQSHANDMACNNLFVHTGSDGSTPQSRVAATGYIASNVSENVYGSYPPLSGADVVNWWINDKTDIRHNENLLSTTFTEIGIGYAFFGNYGYYVIVFAKP